VSVEAIDFAVNLTCSRAHTDTCEHVGNATRNTFTNNACHHVWHHCFHHHLEHEHEQQQQHVDDYGRICAGRSRYARDGRQRAAADDDAATRYRR
jgi:hypothetical protein